MTACGFQWFEPQPSSATMPDGSPPPGRVSIERTCILEAGHMGPHRPAHGLPHPGITAHATRSLFGVVDPIEKT